MNQSRSWGSGKGGVGEWILWYRSPSAKMVNKMVGGIRVAYSVTMQIRPFLVLKAS